MPFLSVFLLLITSVSPFPLSFYPLPVEPAAPYRVTTILVYLVVKLGVIYLVVVELRYAFIQHIFLLYPSHLVEQLGIRLISSLKFETRHLIEIDF